ncbi:MAG: hypothetical protein MUF74_13490 [Cypionkella sp.]|jgi:hypothetical protein|nr:hypothetical protein [Cypionkella sp.]
MRRAAVAVTALALAGCQPTGGGGGPEEPPPLPRQISVLEGAVRVAGPVGYCPDPSSLAESAGQAVVVLGRCSDSAPVTPAAVSVAVGPAGSAGALAASGAGVARFLTTAEGRASLSRRGRAGDVAVLSVREARGILFVLVEDRAVGRYWRGMMPLNGRLVSISALGPELAPEEGRAIVEATARALRRTNGAGGTGA